MSITEVPVLPYRAGRHLITWIVWHAVQTSWIDDVPNATSTAPSRKRRKRSAAA